jgi:hypothetical protein
MNVRELKLNSVNWEHGMLLTPDHFIRQERYFDFMLAWVLRYAGNVYGLVGGGPRLAEMERGAARHDPIVTLGEDDVALTVTVSQCRAITSGGSLVDIGPESAIQERFVKADLEGVQETPVYVVREAAEKETLDGEPDEFNPQMKTERRVRYRVALKAPAGQEGHALACARIRRPRYGTGYEKDPDFIPQCATMTAHSELAAAHRKILEQTTFLADRYAELHRAMLEYQTLFTERGIETEVDTGSIHFVDRMVVALQDCVYELLDSAQPPDRFFGRLRRFFHAAAVYFDLTPGMQIYYEILKQAGETTFLQLIEQQKRILQTTRSLVVRDDLGVESRTALAHLSALLKLEQALEGKYLDFRVSTTLEGMNFIFDRGGNVLYKLSAKPSRTQGTGGETITWFSQLRLEGRDKYRLVLVGEPGAVFEKGARLTAEVRINEGSGFQRAPLNLASEVRVAGQVNFEMDFEQPDVPTITEIKVAVASHHPIRTALLFSRHRFFAGSLSGSKDSGPQQVEPIRHLAEPRVEPVAPAPPPLPPQSPQSGDQGKSRATAPWDVPNGSPAPRPRLDINNGDASVPPPRRRRLL